MLKAASVELLVTAMPGPGGKNILWTVTGDVAAVKAQREGGRKSPQGQCLSTASSSPAYTRGTAGQSPAAKSASKRGGV